MPAENNAHVVISLIEKRPYTHIDFDFRQRRKIIE